MNCPRCHKQIEDDLPVCPFCRKKLGTSLIVDSDFVIGEIDAPREEANLPKSDEEEMVMGTTDDHPREKKRIPKIYLFVNAVLIVGIGVFAFWMATRQSSNMTALYTPTDAVQPTINAAFLAEIPTTQPTDDVAEMSTGAGASRSAVSPSTVPATTQAQQTTAASTTAAITATQAASATGGIAYIDSGDDGYEPYVVPYTPQRIYFDNSAYSWSQVNVYVYTPDSETGTGTWTSSAMTRGADNVFSYTIPRGLENSLCYFAEQDGSTDRRYPPEQSFGLPLNGKSMMLKADYVWEEFSGKTPSTQPTQPPAGKVMIGDIDMNGAVTIKDATLLQLHLAFMQTLSGDSLIAADLDKNKSVNVQDITLLQRYLAGFDDDGSYCGEYTDSVESTTQATELTEQTELTELTEGTEWTDATVGFGTIYFRNNDSWSTVFAHVRNSGADTAAGGYDVQMTDLGNGVWYVEYPDSCDMVVFHDGSSVQTDESFIPEAGQIYDGGSWSAYGDSVPVTQFTTSLPENSVLLNPGACNTGNEVWYAWTWGNSNYRWVKGEPSGSGYVFRDLDFSVVFVRMNGDNADWGNVLNQTDSLITQTGGTYTITGWGNGNLMKGLW